MPCKSFTNVKVVGDMLDKRIIYKLPFEHLTKKAFIPTYRPPVTDLELIFAVFKQSVPESVSWKSMDLSV
jgi:hypothetical protein